MELWNCCDEYNSFDRCQANCRLYNDVNCAYWYCDNIAEDGCSGDFHWCCEYGIGECL